MADNFLVENKDHWLSDYDFNQIETYIPMSIFTDAVLEIFDTMNSAIDKMPDLLNIDKIPDDLLPHIEALIGWRQTDYQFNYLTFKDLLKNIVSIYKIKGTSLSYDVFFRALGYNAELKELWWNVSGELVDTKPIGAPDPTKPTNILNKSNFLEINLTLNTNDPAFPEPFSNPEFLSVVFEYLTFLKPIHIRYKPLFITVPEFRENPVVTDFLLTTFHAGNFAASDGLFEDRIEGDITDDVSISSYAEFVNKPLAYYNNTLRYGTNIVQTTTLGNITFPSHIIQRSSFLYGGASPLPDEIRIVAQLTHETPDSNIELRYSNYIYYDNTAQFNASQDVTIDDDVEFDSQDMSFGFGDVFGQPPSSGTVDSSNELGHV